MISVLGAEKLSLVEIEAFLAASESVRFAGCGRTEIYGWVERLLRHHEYPLQKRRAKGLLRAYIEQGDTTYDMHCRDDDGRECVTRCEDADNLDEAM